LLQRARAAGGQAYPGADYDLAVACFLLARVLKTAGGSEQSLPLLDEARRRFEAIAQSRASKAAEGMVSACITEQGGCLLYLGRLDEATAAYEEAIRRNEQLGDDRGVAGGKGQLGTVRMRQRRYPEALAAYAEARERFTQLDEPGSVAAIWHQTGMVYQAAGQPEAAEDAYRKSLALEVRPENVAEQASTLGQLGILYKNVLDRPEEAAAFYRQAADKYVEIGDVAMEGRVRSNLANVLRKLRRLDEARQKIRRAIECDSQYGHASEPWTAWSILSKIETDAGNPTAAAEAKSKAIACYLVYRRDGGENHDGPGRLVFDMTEKLCAGGPAAAASFLQQVAANPQNTPLFPFIQALQAIVSGSRDRTLAEHPDLDYTMAAEILFLIETLEKAG
jgi:tetratricopeptide (TPR) repeat protein